MRKVEVCPYSNEWRVLFETEKKLLQHIFEAELLEIHHIGSTSIRGMKAKPIIDIMPIVINIHNIDSYNGKMIEIGYEAKGENGISGRRYFQKGGDERTHHVHIYEAGSPEIFRHLAFRDFLRANKEEAEKYGDLKEKLSQKYPADIQAYINGKHDAAASLEQKALKWANLRKSNLHFQ
ncbi:MULTISPECIES: GrpB family protein [Bacillaceae]|uniref:GrpB family protein n=1 Tax=Bacillaceae TaxID=186817 RepID=UPI001E440BBC|nr:MULTISPECIES: GrpB family protein [Bacillaceae]MCE4050596.1 GrpB family protein [Bacillus sp. Au-Bac7]MCM3032004.1 GrpB family protein [Niallia sp. MER 6]MDL0435991.1 GrpB family protein [Niallia sp. SS-2023]UPO87859.1 GrpB family protein [Niallia sp. Man26]